MNKIAFILITFLLTGKLFAQAEPRTYVQATAMFKFFYNENKPDSIFNQFSPELKTALPEDKFKTTTTQLKNQLGSLIRTDFIKYQESLSVYKATFQNAVFLLTISLNKQNQLTGLLLSPYQITAAEDPNITESPILLKTFSGTLSGTLALPKNATGKVPLVIIVPAYGQIDRDGNGPKFNTNDYKLLASALGKSGMATIRYDKRMVGQSVTATKETDMRFDDYFEDVYSLIGMLSEDKRFSKIVILGHGQGSLVGMIAATDDHVKAFISVEGAAIQADKILTEMINKTYPKYIADGFKPVLDSLRRGKIDYKVDPALYPVARPSLQPSIVGWWRFDPLIEIKKLKKPILIIQGTTDLEIDINSGERLRKGKTPELAIINGMNYVLKDAPLEKDKNLATYNQPELPLKPELITTIVEFINKLN